MKHEGWSSLKYEAANRPHHACRAADRDGPRRRKWGGSERITQTERGTCWWKLILKGWPVFIMGSWKGCPRLRNEHWFGLNGGDGGRIWYKEWFMWWWSWKSLRQPSRPTAPLYRRDRRAATDVLCGTNHLYDQCLVESTAQTKLVCMAYRTRGTTIAWNTVAKPCSSNPA